MPRTGEHVLYPELSHAIVGCAMAVHSELGPGWDEIDYHRALRLALDKQGLRVHSKLAGTLHHKGLEAAGFELDLLIENLVILELKHLRQDFAPANYVQIINYLKFWQKDLGVLLNFGLERLRFKRIPYTATAGSVEYVDAWKKIEGDQTDILKDAAQTCENVWSEHGPGYSETVYAGLVKAECLSQDKTITFPHVNLVFRGVDLGPRPVGVMLSGSNVLIHVTALKETTCAADLARLRSYVRRMNGTVGLLANFGRRSLRMCPVIAD